MTVMHLACAAGELEVAEVLIELGADITIKDKSGRSPCIVALQYGNEDLVNFCKAQCHNQGQDHELSFEPDDLPLWSLVKLQRLDLIGPSLAANSARLLENEPGTGYTALHCAIIDLDQDIPACIRFLEELLSRGTQYMNEVDNCGRTPLHLAALNGNEEATNFLLEHDPQQEPDRFGLTPLSIAFKNNHYQIAVMLIEAGADISAANIDLQKMLFKAIELQSVQAVRNLFLSGADATAPDDFGRTANQLAKLSGDVKLMNVVRSTKSFMYQVKGTPTNKPNTIVSVLEMFDDTKASQIACQLFQSRQVSFAIEAEENLLSA